MKIRPFEDRVIIKQDAAPQEQEGIAIPDQSQVAPATGLVVAVGPGIIKGESLQLKAIFGLLKWAVSTWWWTMPRKGLAEDTKMPDFSADYSPMQVKVNDRVTFGKYAGTKIKYQGEEYMMVRQSDVFFADDAENP